MGIASALDIEEAVEAVRGDGVALVESLWPRKSVESARKLSWPAGEASGAPADSVNSGEGRFIVPVEITASMVETGMLGNPELEKVLELVLGPDFVFEAFGMMMAGAGAPDQHVHRDMEPLYPETGIDPLLPPTALTVAIPLVDVGEANGRTAFYPGSHRSGTRDGIEPVSVAVPLGSALIWDFRTIHYGCANETEEDRSLLYFTACRKFWHDNRNFGKRHRRLVVERDVVGRLGKRFVRAEVIERNE